MTRPMARMAVWLVAAVALYAAAGATADSLGRAFAQEAGQAPAGGVGGAQAAQQGADPPSQSVGGMIVGGDSVSLLFYVVLGLFSVWAMAVALERLINLRRDKLLPPTFVATLKEMLRSGGDTVENLQQLSNSTPSPAGRILHAGVLKAGRTLPEVEKSMEDAAAREMAQLRTRNRPLSVVGSVAPLVGLLGTVVGMIFAFQISSQQGLGKAEQLAGGIYLALMTTAAGLTIAIPCLLLVAWFNTKVERFMCDIDECLMETMPSFIRMEGRVSPPVAVGSGPRRAAEEPAPTRAAVVS